MIHRMVAGVIVALLAATIVAAPSVRENRFHFVLRPAGDSTAGVLGETAVVRPHDMIVVLEQPGLWWMRYAVQSDHDQCTLREVVEVHDLTRDKAETMNIEGYLQGCVAPGVIPGAARKLSPASVPPAIERVISGPLADAAAVQRLAQVAYERLSPLLSRNAAPSVKRQAYRVEEGPVDCWADARHGAPCD